MFPGLPETPDHLNAILTLQIGKETFQASVPLSYKKLDPVKGDVVEALRIVPDVTLDFTELLIVTKPDGSINANVRLHAFKEVQNATLTLSSNTPVLEIKNLSLREGTDTVISLRLSAALLAKAGKEDYSLSLSMSAGGRIYDKSLHLIRYSHLPTLQYFTTPSVPVLHNNWKSTVKRIGYIEGAGDYTATFLRLAGLNVEVLQDADFTNAAKLKQYEAIVTGVRAVNTEKRMRYWLPVLHQYVQNGGTLVMQYNTLQDMSTTRLGTYPFTITNGRVTEEDATVTFINPAHRLLNYPNKITAADFAGWVQERGVYFSSAWDPHYEPLFRMNDTGEQPLEGATLYTKYGKGHFIYTSLAFFRQIPAGNKGAIRLLMNMLSVGK